MKSRNRSDKISVLVVGEATAPTGYSRVIRSIFSHLHSRLTINQLALRFDGDPHDYPWKLYPAHTGGDPYGFRRLPTLIARLRPDIVFILTDISYQTRYMGVLKVTPGDFRVVIYSPIESGPVTCELMEKLAGVSRYVVYTRYARQEVEATLERLQKRGSTFSRPILDIIPHGVDSTTFHPLALRDARDGKTRRMRARKLLFPGQPELHDAFIVLNANRNQPRKQIDLTMKGFACFAAGKPSNVKLYLHMGIEDRGWNVIVLAHSLGIADRLILTSDENSHPELSLDRLNLLFNACDVGINTASGEGWGLVSFEHAATRAAQIVPRHTSQIELWQGAAEWAEPVMTLTNTGILNEAHIVSPESIASALERLYADADYREMMATKAYENSRKNIYRWEIIAEQWQGLFEEEAGLLRKENTKTGRHTRVSR